MPTLYKEYLRKANKTHKCCECKTNIRKGEYYFCCKGIWETKWFEYKVCKDCEQLRREYGRELQLYISEYPAFTCLGDEISCDGDEYFINKWRLLKIKRELDNANFRDKE